MKKFKAKENQIKLVKQIMENSYLVIIRDIKIQEILEVKDYECNINDDNFIKF